MDKNLGDRRMVEDPAELDWDKQIAMDLARIDYDSRIKILYLDADEFVGPSTQSLGRVQYTLASLRQALYEEWHPVQLLIEERTVYRNAVSAFTPTRVIHIENKTADGDMVARVQDCTMRGEFVRECVGSIILCGCVCLCRLPGAECEWYAIVLEQLPAQTAVQQAHAHQQHVFLPVEPPGLHAHRLEEGAQGGEADPVQCHDLRRPSVLLLQQPGAD